MCPRARAYQVMLISKEAQKIKSRHTEKYSFHPKMSVHCECSEIKKMGDVNKTSGIST